MAVSNTRMIVFFPFREADQFSLFLSSIDVETKGQFSLYLRIGNVGPFH